MPAMSISAARLVCLDSEKTFLERGNVILHPRYCLQKWRLLVAHLYFVSQLNKTEGHEVPSDVAALCDCTSGWIYSRSTSAE